MTMDLQSEITKGSMGSLALTKVKDASIFLGILYGIAFLIVLPMYLAQGFMLTDTLAMVGLMVVVVLAVHFITNVLYYLVVIVPLVMAAIFFGLGAYLWLSAPLAGMFLGVISDVVGMIVGGSLSSVLDNYIEFLTRVGQALMAIGGALWWMVKKAKEINYRALYIYIIFLAFVSIFTGFIKPDLGILFLILIATLSFKVKHAENADDLRLVLKVASSATVFVVAYKTYYISQNAWYGESWLMLVYAALIFLVGTFGIWQPKFIINKVPSPLIAKFNEFLKVISMDKVKKIFGKFIYVNISRR